MSNIYILSEPIQNGKTSLLMHWAAQQQSIHGILTPDIDGKRQLYDLSTRELFELELPVDEKGIEIGRFIFSKNGFEKAREILNDTKSVAKGWVVVDEIGRLETDRNEGLEPALGDLINHFKITKTDTKILLIIRDYLLADVIRKYGLEQAQVIDRTYFEQKHSTDSNLYGLVLCGGKSERMGEDKAFISYHNKPQYEYVADQMKLFCNEVFISCNTFQREQIKASYNTIIDNPDFANNGPISGLLTAFKTHPDRAFFIMGCDYPYLSQQNMMQLITHRETQNDTVCFKNTETGFEEPLLAIYEKQCCVLLSQYFNKGNTSLRHFIETVRSKFLTTDNKQLKSVDTKI